MFAKYCSIVCVLVISVSCENDTSAVERHGRNESQEMETTTYKYPTATWSAKNYEMKRKKYNPEMMIKLFLFKPSPFLKPPFTDGNVGSSITAIDDNVNVSGRRRGKVRGETRAMMMKKPFIQKLEPMQSRRDDSFLEQALTNYIKSANLTDEFGMITVEEFSEALRRITESRKGAMVYEENKDMRRKFRDDVLNPKRAEATPLNGILEKQYQRRLQKTWDVISENISTPSRYTTLDQRVDWEMGNPRETQDNQGQPTTHNYLFSHITPSTTEMTSESPDNWITSETTPYDDFPPPTPEAEKTSEKFRVSETGWRNVIFSTTTESILGQTKFEPTQNLDTNEISLTTPETYDETPTTFRPRYSVEMKNKIKAHRGKKKWRDTLPVEAKTEKLKNWDDGEVKLSVAETVYYRPRQTQLESFQYEPTFGAIPGEPEKDYPMLASAPSTGFKCPKTNGDTLMIADHKARCQVFYICSGDGPPAQMLCPNGTLFNENVLVCDWWYNVEC